MRRSSITLALAGELGDCVRFVYTDVTSQESGEVAVALALRVLAGLHGFVNCAGIAPSKKVNSRQYAGQSSE